MTSSSTSSSKYISESRFFRFGRFSKASRKSSSGYSNQSFSQNENEDIYSDIYQLGHRSASLSTLPSSISSATQLQLEQMRIAQLQSLEQKMASIAVSLTTNGGRRLTTPGVGYPHALHGPLVSNSPAKSVNSGQTGFKQLRAEIDILRKIIFDKDAIIKSLQEQIVDKRHCSMQHSHSRLAETNSNERRQMEQRLNCLNRDIEAKKVVIKNLQIALQHTDVSDNIDSRIRQAELEYQLEREETNLLNLRDEKRSLLLQTSGSEWLRKSEESSPSFFKIFAAHSPVVVITCAMDYKADDPQFIIQQQTNKVCSVKENCPLQSGDRVVEINGVVLTNGQESSVLFKSGRLEIVAWRVSHEKALVEEIAQLSAKCDRLVKEKDSVKTENLRLKHRISYLEEAANQEESSSSSKPSLADGLPVYRSEVQVSTMPVRQKPPRTSKLGKQNSSLMETAEQPVSTQFKRPHSSLDYRNKNTESRPTSGVDGTLQKLPIIDRPYGHVIRVTHHHHPRNGTGDSSATGRPPSPTESEAPSVASADLLGYVSDDLGLPGSYTSSGTRKPKPVPPRKPSFLYLNRASSLQSVAAGGNLNSLERSRTIRQQRPSLTDNTDTESESVVVDNVHWHEGKGFSLAGNLKWPINVKGSNAADY